MRKTVNKWIGLVVILLCVLASVIVLTIFKSNYNTNNFVEEMKQLGYNIAQLHATESHELNSIQTNIVIGKEEIPVYEYKNKSSLKQAVSHVQNTGNITVNGITDWVIPPHFYKKNKIIVVYYGNDPKLNSDLKKILGNPFSGD